MPDSSTSLSPALAKALSSNDLAKVEQAWQALADDQRPDSHVLGSWAATAAGGKASPALAAWLMRQSAELELVTEVPGVGYRDCISQALIQENRPLLEWMFTQGGRDPNRGLPGGGPTPLMEALDLEKWDIAESLLGWGADINACIGQRQTALHRAAQKYEVQAMVWLVAHGADPSQEDTFGHQPCELIPQNPGKEWRPDTIFQWLGECAEMDPEERKVIPSEASDEALVEKHGLQFVTTPCEEWSEEEARTAQVLVDRGLLPAHVASPGPNRPRLRPR